jgi:hypothetical protein
MRSTRRGRRRRSAAARRRKSSASCLAPRRLPGEAARQARPGLLLPRRAGPADQPHPRDHGKTHIQSLFGRRSGLVHTFWPRFGKPDDDGEPTVTGWKPEVAAEILQAACAHAGLFDPQGKVRGRGAWRGPNGELIIHHGDKVYRSGSFAGFAWEEPDLIDGYVYPTAPAMPRPDIGQVDDKPGVLLLSLLRSGIGSGRRSTPICCSASSPRPRSAARSTGDRTCG